MRFIWMLLVALTALGFPSFGFAMDLNSVYSAALAHNESIASAQEGVVQADETLRQAWGSLIPQISASAQWEWQQAYHGANGALSPDYSPLTKITLSQPMFQGFREYKGLNVARAQFAGQQKLKGSAELEIYKSLVTSYYSILSFEQDLKNLSEEIRYIQDEIKLLTRWRDIGRVQMTDVLTARSNLTAQQVLVEQTAQQLELARDQFALTTGLPPNTPLQEDAPSASPQLAPLETYLRTIPGRPDIQGDEKASEASRLNIDVARANHIPSLGLTASLYPERAGIQKNVNGYATLSLTIPIFEGGVTQSKVRQAASLNHQAELALSLARRTAEQEIHQFYDQVASDLRLLELNTENSRVNELNYKENEKYLRLGLVPYLNVITALTNYTQAKRTLDQNRYSLKSDFARLKAATAQDKAALLR